MPDEAAAAVKDVIPATAEWVKSFIVALKICPFAKEPLNKGTIRYTFCPMYIQCWKLL